MTEYQVAFQSRDHGNGTHRTTADTESEALENFLDEVLGIEASVVEIAP